MESSASLKYLCCFEKYFADYAKILAIFFDTVDCDWVFDLTEYDAITDKYKYDALVVISREEWLNRILDDQAQNSKKVRWVHSLFTGLESY